MARDPATLSESVDFCRLLAPHSHEWSSHVLVISHPGEPQLAGGICQDTSTAQALLNPDMRSHEFELQ